MTEPQLPLLTQLSSNAVMQQEMGHHAQDILSERSHQRILSLTLYTEHAAWLKEHSSEGVLLKDCTPPVITSPGWWRERRGSAK